MAAPSFIPQLHLADYYFFQYMVIIIYLVIIYLVIVFWKTKETRHNRKIGMIVILLIMGTLLGSALNQFNSSERFYKFIGDVGVGLKKDIEYRNPEITLEIIEAKPPETTINETREMGGTQNLLWAIELYLEKCQCKSVKIYFYDHVYYFIHDYEVLIFEFNTEIHLYQTTNTITMISGIMLALCITWKMTHT